MSFARVFKALEDKLARKNHSLDGLLELNSWLTGYKKNKIKEIYEADEFSYKEFFDQS